MATIERLYSTQSARQTKPVSTYSAPPASRAERPLYIEYGGLSIDMARRTATIDGQSIHLTKTECALLAYLTAAGGRVVTDEQLLYGVWGAAYADCGDYLHVYMHRLRRKLDAPDRPSLIVTEHRIGYRLRCPVTNLD